MSETTTYSSSFGSFTQLLKTIEGNPLSPALWEGLAAKVRSQNDLFSAKSLEIIIEGLKRIQKANTQADQENGEAPKISKSFQSTFMRLSRGYNNPSLLKDVGLIYLSDLSMPDVALQHFECSMRLGGPEKELRPLSEAAVVAMQKKSPKTGDDKAAQSRSALAQHAKPIASNLISKTGSMLMRSRIRQLPDLNAADTIAAQKITLDEPLPATAAACMEEADEAINHGMFNRAEMLLAKADKEPSERSAMWQAWTNLGLACYEAGSYSRVETAFAKALDYNSGEVASHFNVGLGYHLNDKQELALAAYQKAVEMDPTNSKIWCNLGVLHFQRNHYSQAEYALRSAIRTRSDYARAWDNLAATLGAQDRLEEALWACRHTIELNPDYPEAHFKMGIIYFSQNEVENAIAEFQLAALLPSLKAHCEAFQAMIHARLGEMDMAEAAIQRSTQADPNCDLLWMAWNDIGKAWNAAGNYQQAVKAHGEAAILRPEQPESWALLSFSYQELGDHESAIKSHQQAQDLNVFYHSPAIA